MKVRIGWMVLSAVAAIGVLVATNYSRFTRKSVDPVTVEMEVVEDEDGHDIAYTKPADPGQRKQVAELMKQAAALPEDQWQKTYSLTNSQGQAFGSEQLKGAPYIANFFFSTCPSSCPLQADQLRLLQASYKDTPLKYVSISVDPQHDTPDALAAHAIASNADPDRWYFLTGEMKQISKISAEVFLTSNMREKFHSDVFCLVNAEGVLVGKYNWKDPEELKHLRAHIDELLN
jgi:protein SCO1